MDDTHLKIIDFSAWPRADVFKYFISDLRCVMTLTASMDVTTLVTACKVAQKRFYPACIYLIAAAVNKRPELRMGFDPQGNVGLWEAVWPSYIVFDGNDEAFTRLVTPFEFDFTRFYDNVTTDMRDNVHKRGFENGAKPANTFDVSCLPWINYTAFDMHVFDEGRYIAPVITWGKYTEQNGRLLMPLTMQIHHAVADGFHLARFFADIEMEMAELERELTA